MINLLPPSIKKDILDAERFRLIAIWGVCLFAFLVSLASFLFLVRASLWSQIESSENLLQSAKSQFSKQEATLAEIEQLNAMLASIEKVSRESPSLTKMLEGLTEALPEGASIASFTYTPQTAVQGRERTSVENAKIAVTGFAPTREILLKLRENIQNSALFSNASFPPSNWVQAKDIIFSFSAEVR